MKGLSRKIYLDLSAPTEEDQRSDQQRILEGNSFTFLERGKWELVNIESGDTVRQHYGLAVDLGSTTVVARLVDCNSGEILGEESCFNKQIQKNTVLFS